MIPAPMQGTIVKVHVKAGDRVGAGDPVCVLEAMKMENEVTSPVEGEVVDLRIRPGDTVSTGAVLAIVRTDTQRIRLPSSEQISSTANSAVPLRTSSAGLTSTNSAEVMMPASLNASIIRCASR